jgi:hypothetical protein
MDVERRFFRQWGLGKNLGENGMSGQMRRHDGAFLRPGMKTTPPDNLDLGLIERLAKEKP